MTKLLSKNLGQVEQHIRLARLPPMGKQHFAKVKSNVLLCKKEAENGGWKARKTTPG